VIVVWPEQAAAIEARCRPTSWLGVAAVTQAVAGIVWLTVGAWIWVADLPECMPLALWLSAFSFCLLATSWFAYLGRPWALNWACGGFISTSVLSFLFVPMANIGPWLALAPLFHIGAALAFWTERGRMRFADEAEGGKSYRSSALTTSLASVVGVALVFGFIAILAATGLHERRVIALEQGSAHTPALARADQRAQRKPMSSSR
jgi:hypothetical protein